MYKQLSLFLLLSCIHLQYHAAQTVDLGNPYGEAILIEDINCSAAHDAHDNNDFKEFPAQASTVETILDRNCRIIKNDSEQAQYIAYRLGRGKGLKAGAAYLIRVHYPENAARSMYLLNRGNETGIGLACGEAVADCVTGRYVNNSPESIEYPLAQEYVEWETYFHLHDRFPAFKSIRGRTERTETPANGFWFVIAHNKTANAPLSQGIAVARIQLFEVPNTTMVEINTPPKELPQRYIFCREEMADGVVRVPHGQDEPLYRGLDNPIDWFEYKAKYMQFSGMNTFSKDLLEFSHNQGWAATPTDNSWYVQSSVPDRWQRMLAMLKKYNLNVMPMYEYGGSTGENAYGKEKDILSLNGRKKFTHIDWLEKNSHVDVTDPRTLEELKKIVQITILDHKDTVPFIGAWLRPRPMQMPMSFSDSTLARYNKEMNKKNITRTVLQNDKAALHDYYTWWFEKRAQLLEDLSAFLRDGLGHEATVMLTADASEPGYRLPNNVLVTDNIDKWKGVMGNAKRKLKPISYTDTVNNDLFGKACTSPRFTWADYEVHHASPWDDPENFHQREGALITRTFHRLFSVSNP
ncbi:MAG: hypothetical protein HRU15_02305, partial [Planctomycetes bacterium]|nr:hypothetical protein [Planctomycetota bacterium]